MPKKATKEYIAEEDLLYEASDGDQEAATSEAQGGSSLVLIVFLCIFLPIAGFVAGAQYMSYSVVPTKVLEAVQPLNQTVRQLQQDNLSLSTEVQQQSTLLEAIPFRLYESQLDTLLQQHASITLKGLYRTNEKTAGDVTDTCYQLELYEFPQNRYHEAYVLRAVSGNNVQQVTAEGQLLLNLPWDDIPEADQEIIAAATSTPVTLQLRNVPPNGRDAGPCYSLVEYRGIEIN